MTGYDPGRPPARRTGDPESSHSLTGATDGSAPLQDIQSQGATSPNRIFSLTACVDHERPGRQYRFNLLEQEESFLATRHQGSRARVHDRDALSTSAISAGIWAWRVARSARASAARAVFVRERLRRPAQVARDERDLGLRDDAPGAGHGLFRTEGARRTSHESLRSIEIAELRHRYGSKREGMRAVA